MKEGDLFMMDEQYHNPYDYWRQRKEPWEYDDIEHNIKLAAKIAATVFVVALLGIVMYVILV